MSGPMTDKYKSISDAFARWRSGRSVPDKVPSEWFTAVEFSEQNKIHRSTGWQIITRMMKANEIVSKTFNVLGRDGKIQKKIHYKLTWQKEKRNSPRTRSRTTS